MGSYCSPKSSDINICVLLLTDWDRHATIIRTSPPGLCGNTCTLGGILLFGVIKVADREFKTIEEQIAILSSRGLKIEDIDVAKNFLLFNNYYRVSGYSLTLRNHDVFAPTATMKNIMDIYLFDHELRYILLKYIEIIEVTFKSVYAYEFAKIYGSLGYLDSKHFNNYKKYLSIINKVEEQKSKNLSHEAYIKHFVEELNQPLPIWAYIDLFSISDISILYSISDQALKKTIARIFGLTMNEAPDIMEKFMHCITIIRNLCAHGSRLYNRLFITKPSLNSKEKRLLNKCEDGSIDNSHLYGYILNMRRLLEEQEFNKLKSEIILLSNQYSFVDMKYYGFGSDWRSVL